MTESGPADRCPRCDLLCAPLETAPEPGRPRSVVSRYCCPICGHDWTAAREVLTADLVALHRVTRRAR